MFSQIEVSMLNRTIWYFLESLVGEFPKIPSTMLA